VRAELLNTCTAGIDTNTMTTFTLLLVIQAQRYMWSLDKVGVDDEMDADFVHLT